MKQADFGPKAPGDLVKNFDGHAAFLPHPLPATFGWTNSLVNTVSAADQALGRLAGLGRRFPNPQRLVRMFLRREAELSSRIENTHARVQTMVLFRHLPGLERETPSVREVDNNFRTLEFAVATAEHRPLSSALIREMHAILLEGVRGSDQTPGRFRQVQAHIGRSERIEEARFVPPPPHAVPPCMDALERYLNSADGLPTVLRAAMVHYQFEAIHPFADGNGRVGRVLLLLQLAKEGVLPAPLLNPSAQLERHRDTYYDGLLGVSHRGEWNNWFEFFARSLAEEAADAARRIERFETLRDEYYARVRTPRASALLPRLVDELFGDPSVTVRDAARLLQIQFSSAAALLDKLLAAGIVREVTGQQRNRVFLAQGVIDLFSADDQSPEVEAPS